LAIGRRLLSTAGFKVLTMEVSASINNNRHIKMQQASPDESIVNCYCEKKATRQQGDEATREEPKN
jgi:hypothetical protein